jgi:exopolysaccharide biosynthesis polyprenyl glycosylphosphotransferase
MMGDTPHLGAVEDILNWHGLPEIDRIVVTVTSTAQARVRELIDRIRNLPHEIILVLDLDGFNPEHTSLARVVDAPAAYVSGAPKDVHRAALKRAFDLFVAAAAAVVLAVPMAMIALLIRLDSRGPVLFRQKRHGFNNEIIRVWKFRTMRPDKAAETGVISQTIANDPRVTRIGHFLRMSSLDELPQIFNVLKGEMSIVGPRPHAVGMTAGSIEVTRPEGDYAHRHRMKPGMTGWAQVNGSRGPCHTPDEVRERVRLDMDYVNRASIWLDVWIVLKTLPCLLSDREKNR